MNNILFELIVSRQCNKRCKYCDLEFESKYQTDERLIEFSNFLKTSYNQVGSILVNFFGWEALLDYKWIQRFIWYNTEIPNIKYSLWTNGILIDDNIALYLKSKNVALYFSIDSESPSSIYEKNSLRLYDDLTVNFILNPNTISGSIKLLNKIIDLWYRRFNFIPVFSTIRWDVTSFAILKNFREYVDALWSTEYVFYSYYEKPTSDIQFIFDTNGYFYRDIHTHLWIMKQLSYLSKDEKSDIEIFTRLNKLEQSLDLWILMKKHKQKEVIRKSYDLAKAIWYDKDFHILDKIIKK